MNQQQRPKKGSQTIKLLLKLDLISTTRSFDLSGKQRTLSELTKIAKRRYSSIINMGGEVTVVESSYLK